MSKNNPHKKESFKSSTHNNQPKNSIHEAVFINDEYELNENEMTACHFYKEKYINSLSLTDKTLEDKIKDKSSIDWKFSSVLRYNTAKAMALNLFIDTTNTIISVYKIKDITSGGREVIYNIAYINVKPNNKAVYFDDNITPNKTADASQHGNLYINNICPVGSTVSKDGEYRPILIYWRMINYILNKHKELNILFKEIHEYFVDKFQDRKLLIYSHNYFPTDDLKNKYSFEVELMISNRKLEFFSVSWFIIYYTYIFGTISDHLNQLYQKIMFKYKHEDIEFFKLLITKHTIEVIRYMYHIFSTNIRSTTDRGLNSFCKIKLGQKLIPISLREIQYQFDIRYKPWKEYFVNLKLSDLVVNQVTPGFPITTNWIFIKNTDEFLFDNPSQYSRMEKSTSATQISNILNQARYLTKQQIKPSHLIANDDDLVMNISKKNNNILTSWISREFQILHNKIDDAIVHSHSNIAMSNVTFCIFTEYVGKTLYESIFITKKSHYYKQMVQNIFSETGYSIFERFMFELAYSLYCASSKFGIIHGDLHMHNITLNDLFYKSWINMSITKPKVMYILGKNYEYVFDTNFYFMTIIDFSRCILDPSKVNIFRHETLHKTFDIVENMKDFEEQQKFNLTNYLFSCKPEYKEFGLPLLNGIRTHYSVYFKILSVLDLFMITSRFLVFFKLKKDLAFTPFAGCISLIKNIHSRCDLFITNTLESLTKENEITIEKHRTDNWPILDIIDDVFAHKNIKNTTIDPKDIVDIYNYDNELTYSLNNTSKLPPIFKDLSKTNKNDNFIKNSIKRREAFDDQVEKNIKTLLIIKKRQREKNIL